LDEKKKKKSRKGNQEKGRAPWNNGGSETVASSVQDTQPGEPPPGSLYKFPRMNLYVGPTKKNITRRATRYVNEENGKHDGPGLIPAGRTNGREKRKERMSWPSPQHLNALEPNRSKIGGKTRCSKRGERRWGKGLRRPRAFYFPKQEEKKRKETGESRYFVLIKGPLASAQRKGNHGKTPPKNQILAALPRGILRVVPFWELSHESGIRTTYRPAADSFPNGRRGNWEESREIKGIRHLLRKGFTSSTAQRSPKTLKSDAGDVSDSEGDFLRGAPRYCF